MDPLLQPARSRKLLTIVIPGFNEEDRIGKTVKEAFSIGESELNDFEIIVVDDGSSDRTFASASETATELGPKVRVIRQARNQGVGAAYLLGLTEARHPNITLIPGDNAFGITGVTSLFRAVGTADLLVSYRQNMEARTPLRRRLSKLATFLVRAAAGKPIRDAHGLYVFPVREARQIPISPGYSYHLETLVRLLRRVSSYKQIPVDLNPKPDASSGVMKPRTLMILGLAMLKLFALRAIGRL